MQTISYVSITRQGRFLFWLKLLLLFFERLFKLSESQYSTANISFPLPAFHSETRKLYCARLLDSALQTRSWNHHHNRRTRQKPELPAPLLVRLTLPFGAKKARAMSTRSRLPLRPSRQRSQIQPRRGVSVCSEIFSLHSISFVNSVRNSCTKYCNDSD